MAELTVQVIQNFGTIITMQPADPDGESFANDGRVIVRIANGSVDSITVTFRGQGHCNFGFTHDRSETVAPGAGFVEFAPFRPDRFNDVNGAVHIAYGQDDDLAGVTIAAYQIA